ncbi:MAG: DegV family protein [Dehalococcoidia bacterium]|nr:DegV family protein [Dehalococcoidia bacterium]
MDTAIIADSIACLTKKQVEEYGIRIIPVNILFNGQVYRDSVDLSSAKAYEFLEKAPEFWRSSAASPEDYLDLYRELSKHVPNVLVVTISSKLSMFYSSALAAKEIFKEESPETVVEVLDSQTAAAAEGLIVLAAARAVTEGKPFPEVVAIAKGVKDRVKFIGLLETIRFVYRTGRIPKVASEIGSMLSIKPVLTGSNGNIRLAAAARNKQNGVKKMLRMMRSDAGKVEPVHVAVMHADALSEARELKEKVAAEFNCVEIFITDFSPIMGYATGPGTLALAYYKEDGFDK